MNIRHLIIPATFLFAAIGAAAPLPDPGPGSGLVVVVGQDDLEQTGKLAAGGRYLVHQLVPAARVAALRAAARGVRVRCGSWAGIKAGLN